MNPLLRFICGLLCGRSRRPTCFAFTGPQGDYTTMLNLKAGQTGTVTFTFQDNTVDPPVSYPLATAFAPTIDDPSKATLVMVKDGTEDGIATATVTPVVGARPGAFNISGIGQGEADGSDPITAEYACAILASDDNAVVITSVVN